MRSNSPRLPRHSQISPLGVVITCMVLVVACFGLLAAVGWVVEWARG